MATIDSSFRWPLKAPTALALVAVLAIFLCYTGDHAIPHPPYRLTEPSLSSTGSGLEISDKSIDNESNTSRTSFRPDYDSEESDNGQFRGSTAHISPEPPLLPNRPEESSYGPRPSVRVRIGPDMLPDFSDDPNDNTDEDIVNIPLDYGRSDRTVVRRVRIEQR
ncbi:hypothetical protein N7509_003862 [Penicillium cosmopolitanum]|uniref:Uncharacterized protein n=1 Tax=Penicillium cosmopolitanum TaxID=1131564 RepID=A0A9X0BBS4_9EURO|nr:uncharacterized protein N7509_003862 [Penicillium cosmopolitanum]KAJ5403991.1 hypothetical protein N7509_003862 [Penicillium cosmopolitanum]